MTAGDRRFPLVLARMWHATWMQTVGATLFAVEWCSSARVWMSAQDGRSAHRFCTSLLYGSAIRFQLSKADSRLRRRLAVMVSGMPGSLCAMPVPETGGVPPEPAAGAAPPPATAAGKPLGPREVRLLGLDWNEADAKSAIITVGGT